MATYRVQAPDGSIHRIEGPDDATPEQIESFASSQFSNQTNQTPRVVDDIGGAHASGQTANISGTAKIAAPPSKMVPPSYDPTEGMSSYDKFMAGAGKSVYDIGHGAGQMLNYVLPNSISNAIGLPTEKDIDEVKKRDAPLMNSGAGQLGYLGGNIATTLLPAGALSKVAEAANMGRTAGIANALINPQTYKAAALVGGLQGALQPTGTNDSRALNTGLGAATGMAGNALINGIGRIAAPFQNTLDTAGQKAVKVLKDAGIPLDAAQLTGSPLLNRIKSSFSDNPITMGAQSEIRDAQGKAFNNAVLNTIGTSGNAADQATMKDASNRIENVFKNILNNNDIKISDDALSRLSAIQSGANDEAVKGVPSVINRVIDSVKDDGTIPGQTAYNIKKSFDRLASSSDSTQNYYARKAKSELMDMIGNSLSAEDQNAFNLARSQFRNMKQIEPAISTEGFGNISPARLASTLGNKSNRQQSLYGNGNQTLVDLAQSGKQLLTDKLPNSGSAARIALQVAPAILAGGAQGIASGDWTDAAKTAAGVAALPKMAQYAINNPKIANYLANGMSQGALRSVMLAPENKPLLGGALRRYFPSTTNTLTSGAQ